MSKIILDWNEYKSVAREMVSEGIILLENNGTLPLKKNCKVSVFGRIQTKYYKSGTGSGGMVNVSEVVTIPDGLRNAGISLNEKLFEIYKNWEFDNPFNEGCGWGTEPWSQIEMPLTDKQVEEAAAESDLAMVIIGRTAGEDKDFSLEKGAYLLSDEEERMLKLVRNNFDKMVLIFNTASLMDLSVIDDYKPDSVLLVWTGGMIGGDGIADVLTGKCPSGRLPDTVAYKVSDYPSHSNYGKSDRNYYAEDIFVGYRYFETFAREKVRYPFGYGLSYTDFEISFAGATESEIGKNKLINSNNNKAICIKCNVKNIGNVKGKQVVQVYIKGPNGRLSKPARQLVAYEKTKELMPQESQELDIVFNYDIFSCYDDSNEGAYAESWILESGVYEIYLGENVREAEKVYSFKLDETLVIEKLEEALKPVLPFKRMNALPKDAVCELTYEDVPLQQIDEEKRRLDNLPEEISQNLTADYCLKDVLEGRITMKEFIATLTDDDLICLVRGEGMGSSLVAPGTASAFAGVSKSLRKKGIPAVCCDDGPSGMRLDSGALAFSLPSGMIISSSFNDELTEKMFGYLSLEMKVNKVDCLLGPGMNIHRYPLNGRNFEYFSEDPLLTGRMALANLKGLNKYGVTGTAKHFCGNNQEKARHLADAVISERALREIYLRGFEIAVKSGELSSIMTTYGSVNGLWTSGNYDLNTAILRKQWGYKGIVMTDWWASISERNKKANKTNLAQMVRAQNDLYMCCSDSENNPRCGEKEETDNFDSSGQCGDNLWQSFENASLRRCELQRSAENILNFAMKSEAMRRLIGTADEVIIEGRNDINEIQNIALEDYVKFEDEITVSLNDRESVAGTDYIIPLEMNKIGYYDISLTGSSNLGELAQLPCTLYYTGVPFATFTFNGTKSKTVTITKSMWCHNRLGLFRLNVARNGLKLETISFKYSKEQNS